jgi:hypothetical protein
MNSATFLSIATYVLASTVSAGHGWGRRPQVMQENFVGGSGSIAGNDITAMQGRRW